MSKKRMIIVAIVLVCGVVLDQWTKVWADANLGTEFHPLPLRIEASEAGKSLGQIIQDRFALDDTGLADVFRYGVRPLKNQPAPNDKAFPADVDCARTRFESEKVRGVHCVAAYVVFHHRTLDMPPRRSPNRNQTRDIKKHTDHTVAEYITSAFSYLDDAQRQEVLDKFVYRVPIRTGQNASGSTYYYWDAGPGTEPAHVVQEGDLYVLLRRNVPLINSSEPPPLLQLKYAENPGAAWSLFADQSDSFRQYFFFFVSIGAILLISFILHGLTPEQGLAAIAFATILSGAIGNFIDRLRFNYVIDFIDMYPGFSYPIYNVADIAITAGVLLLIVEMLVKKKASFLRSTGRQKEEGKA
jgi:lipoprotein signal peptidase